MSRIHAFLLSLTSILCPGCDGTDSSSSNSTGYGTPADSLAARSDWVIDDCRVTYKGKPVPVGSAFPAVVEVFGPPNDSVIGDSTIAGRPGTTTGTGSESRRSPTWNPPPPATWWKSISVNPGSPKAP